MEKFAMALIEGDELDIYGTVVTYREDGETVTVLVSDQGAPGDIFNLRQPWSGQLLTFKRYQTLDLVPRWSAFGEVE